MTLHQIVLQPLHHLQATGLVRQIQVQIERDSMQNLTGFYTGVGEVYGLDRVG